MTANTEHLFAEHPEAVEERELTPARRGRRADVRRRRDGPRGRSGGPRSEARRRRRRQAAVRSVVAIVLAVTVGVAAVAVAGRMVAEPPSEAVAPPSAVEPAVSDPQPTVALATFDETAGRDASQVVLLGYERASGEATALFVPASTVADVPGHGLLEVGRAFGFGAGPLLEATLDNLLGIDVDHVVGVSRQGWSSLFTRIGGLRIELPERLDARLEDGSSQPRFRPGEQFLDGPRVAELLTFRSSGESELETLPRAQRVLLALLDRVAADPAVLERLFEDGAPMLDTTAPPGRLRELLLRLAQARAEDALVVRILPVSPIGSGRESSYRVVEERAAPLVADRFGASRPGSTDRAGRRLQILNGNGVPGIGQRVAERLVPAGYRVVLTRNADRFDHAETRIVVYDDTPEQVAAAEQIRDLLGVGRIEHSRTPFDVADITVVVGLDFLERG